MDATVVPALLRKVQSIEVPLKLNVSSCQFSDGDDREVAVSVPVPPAMTRPAFLMLMSELVAVFVSK
jgi:hypothetical protein